MNICIVAGARPNFMKVAPIVHSIEKAKGQGRDINYQLVYAGREDDPTLEGTLFDDLQLARPQTILPDRLFRPSIGICKLIPPTLFWW